MQKYILNPPYIPFWLWLKYASFMRNRHWDRELTNEEWEKQEKEIADHRTAMKERADREAKEQQEINKLKKVKLMSKTITIKKVKNGFFVELGAYSDDSEDLIFKTKEEVIEAITKILK